MNIILSVNNLKITIKTQNKTFWPVNTVSLNMELGETLALVGESGCGKSMTALSLLRLLPNNAHINAKSEVLLNNENILYLSENQFREIRGLKIAMIFQDPMSALNPVLTIGEQIAENLPKKLYNNQSRKNKIIKLLSQVQLPDPHLQLNRYPHELSGGMKQRVMIAIALAREPHILIADEPTTGLDVSTQAEILDLLKQCQREYNMALLLITHNLGIVYQMANRIAVMYAGHLVEESDTAHFFKNPKHPYSKKLLAALPELTEKNKLLSTIPGRVPSLDQEFKLCRFKDRCDKAFEQCQYTAPKVIKLKEGPEVRCHLYDKEELGLVFSDKNNSENNIILNNNIIINNINNNIILNIENLSMNFFIKKNLFQKSPKPFVAVDNVSFQLREGETLALIGESGSGKTTVGKSIMQLIRPTSGRIIFSDQDLMQISEKKLKPYRAELQMIFQDPFSSMDPRFKIKDIIEEGMLSLKIGTDKQERQDRIDVLLEQVGLSTDIKNRYPHEFSGGQRQRIAIARALAVGPKVIICDEPTSALDVSVQAQILNLLKSLQTEFDIAYLFITHDINIVKYMADRVIVMQSGKIVEEGLVNTVLTNPKHDYTKKLLNCLPKVPVDL